MQTEESANVIMYVMNDLSNQILYLGHYMFPIKHTCQGGARLKNYFCANACSLKSVTCVILALAQFLKSVTCVSLASQEVPVLLIITLSVRKMIGGVQWPVGLLRERLGW